MKPFSDSNNQKTYPPTDGPSSYPPIDSQQGYPPQPMHQQQGYPPHQMHQQQGYPPMPMPPPNYYDQPNNNPNMIPMQPTVITQQPSLFELIFASNLLIINHSLPAATVFIHAAPFSNDPQTMVCPQCRATITTRVKYEPATKTHLFAGLICLMGGWLGCCFIPYCIDACQAAEHSCKFSLKCC